MTSKEIKEISKFLAEQREIRSLSSNNVSFILDNALACKFLPKIHSLSLSFFNNKLNNFDLETILQQTTNLKKLDLHCDESLSLESVKSALKHCVNLESFHYYGNFDEETFNTILDVTK